MASPTQFRTIRIAGRICYNPSRGACTGPGIRLLRRTIMANDLSKTPARYTISIDTDGLDDADTLQAFMIDLTDKIPIRHTILMFDFNNDEIGDGWMTFHQLEE